MRGRTTPSRPEWIGTNRLKCSKKARNVAWTLGWWYTRHGKHGAVEHPRQNGSFLRSIRDIYGYLSKSPFLMVKSAHHVGGILNLCWWKKAHWLRNFVEIVVGQSYHPLRTLGMCILYYIISIYLNLKPCSQKSLITSSVFKITPPSCACCFINHEHINLP